MLLVIDDTENQTREIYSTRYQGPQAGKDRKVALEKLEPASAFNDDCVGSLQLDQCRKHVIQQLLAVEDGHQQPHSGPFEELEGFEKGLSAGRNHQRLEGLRAPRETRQPGQAGQVIGGRVGIAEEAEDETDGLVVE